MSSSVRSWWRNCAVCPDAEIHALDELEDSLSPLPDNVRRIRELIAQLEMCHHKARRHVTLLVEAIGRGQAVTGPGQRRSAQLCDTEQLCSDCLARLDVWRFGGSDEVSYRGCGCLGLGEMHDCLGSRTALKNWQVDRVRDKLQSFTGQGSEYTPLLGSNGEFSDHAEFRQETIQTTIHDTVDGMEAELSLAEAIDNLYPCNWNFACNLRTVLRAIGGDYKARRPFAACHRNIKLSPLRNPMRRLAGTLRTYINEAQDGNGADQQLLERLGEPTRERRWLAGSLDKTIRLQLGL